MADEKKVIGQTEIHKGVGRREIKSIRAFPWMDQLPLQVAFRRDLIKLRFDKGSVLFDEVRRPKASGSSRDAAIDGGAHDELVLKRFLQSGRRLGGPGDLGNRQENSGEQPGPQVVVQRHGLEAAAKAADGQAQSVFAGGVGRISIF